MSDVFVSYATPDRDHVTPVVAALKARGWTVFWDRDLPPGKSWDDVLHRRLQDSRCVVVLWSRHSIGSEWVQHEASIAKYRRVLVPAILDNLPVDQIPSRFRDLKITSLGAADEQSASRLAALLDSVAAVLSRRRWYRRITAAATVGALLIGLGFLGARQLALLWGALRSGVRRVEYHGNDAVGRLGHRIRGARSIKLLLPDANEVTQLFTDDFKQFFANPDASMRVLFATANSTFYREALDMTPAMARDEQARQGALGRVAVSEQILRAAANYRPQIVVQHFDTEFRMPMVIVDDQYCYVSLLLPPDEDSQSLRLEFDGGRDGFNRSCVGHFDRMWHLAENRKLVSPEPHSALP
jgi:hypothetical protein